MLEGADPVLDWVTGTGLRPVLDALADTPAERDEFVDEYRRRLRGAPLAIPSGTSSIGEGQSGAESVDCRAE